MTEGAQLVVGAVIVADGRVLAARRTEPDFLAGQWEFPGGKVEPGEDPIAALVREIQEELSATIEVGAEIVGPDPTWPISKDYVLRLFLATVVDGVVACGPDHDAIEWLTPADFDRPEWLASDRQTLSAVRAALERT